MPDILRSLKTEKNPSHMGRNLCIFTDNPACLRKLNVFTIICNLSTKKKKERTYSFPNKYFQRVRFICARLLFKNS